jgi:hypothetical protein
MDMPFEWDMFLNPNLVMSAQQHQFATVPDAAFQNTFGF